MAVRPTVTDAEGFGLAARTLDEVHQTVKHGLKRLQYRPAPLLGFLAETGLAWEELWST
ncbi:hypothetical protein [Parafrankia elaeagni]|uniref:hypothetical protein n=1 Tax=Parafrankia elaeagni TaxID=222534 RepID=UPI00037AEEEC|nr:hypothetical protein [Parafrankia elaeagni]